MALTPGGLPYPVGTDKVVDGDDAIHALATALDPRIGHGLYVTGAQSTAVTPGDIVVITLPALVLPEARDLVIDILLEGNAAGGAGTGLALSVRDNGGELTSLHAIFPSTTLATNQFLSVPVLAAAAGSHTFSLRALGYGANGNALLASRMSVYDASAAAIA